MSKIAEVKSLLAKYKSDPHVWGRTKQVAGGLLVADGLFGLENPFDGRDKRPGIMRAAIFFVLSLIMAVVGIFLVNEQIDTDASTSGTITSIDRRSSSDGKSVCSINARYTVDGQTYTTGSGGFSSSSWCNKAVGGDVKVNYQSAHPETATVEIGLLGMLLWLFPLMGIVMLLGATALLLVRSVSIVGGAILFVSGWRQARKYPDINGNAAETVQQARREVQAVMFKTKHTVKNFLTDPDATTGEPATGSAAVGPVTGQPGTAHQVPAGFSGAQALGSALGGLATGGLRGAAGAGLGGLLGSALGGASQQTDPAPVPTPGPVGQVSAPVSAVTAPPVAPSVPPAGWYPTADDQHERYWDGSTWSAEARPRTSTP